MCVPEAIVRCCEWPDGLTNAEKLFVIYSLPASTKQNADFESNIFMSEKKFQIFF